jgi:hypothetical protein
MLQSVARGFNWRFSSSRQAFEGFLAFASRTFRVSSARNVTTR